MRSASDCKVYSAYEKLDFQSHAEGYLKSGHMTIVRVPKSSAQYTSHVVKSACSTAQACGMIVEFHIKIASPNYVSLREETGPRNKERLEPASNQTQETENQRNKERARERLAQEMVADN